MAESGTVHLQNVVILRSAAIIGVVLYHAFCPWLYDWNWIEGPSRPLLSFLFNGLMIGRMPLFLSLSGYLFAYLYIERGKYQHFWGFLRNKLRRLLLPCLLFSIILSLTQGGDIIEDFFFGSSYLWFLKVLFVCFIFCWPIGRWVEGKGEIAVLLVVVMMEFLPDIKFFSTGRFFDFFQFFYIGFLICRHREELAPYLQTKKAVIFHISVFALLGFALAAVYAIGNAGSGDFVHTNICARSLMILLRYYTIILGFSIVNYFLENRPEFHSSALENLNTMSYGIYLIHCYLAEIVGLYMREQFIALSSKMPAIILGFLFFVFIFSLSWVFTYLLKKTRIGRYLL